MAKPLVIVESPAKARTIEGFLGGDFTVLASMGHFRDLPSKGLSVAVDRSGGGAGGRIAHDIYTSRIHTLASSPCLTRAPDVGSMLRRWPSRS